MTAINGTNLSALSWILKAVSYIKLRTLAITL